MRRIPRLRPSAVLTQCLQSTGSAPTHAAVSRAAAATRDFSTTPNRTLPSSTGSDLVLPPTERTVAPRVDDLSSDYTPAERADALEVVGGLKDWFAEDKKHYGVPKYVGFAPRYDKDAPPALLELCAARAVLEAVAVATVVRKVKSRKTPKRTTSLLAAKWRDGGREGLDRALQMRWTVGKDGKVEVSEGSHEAVVEALQAVPQEEETVASDGSIAAEEAREILKNLDQRWKRISLTDTGLKFAVRL